MENRTVDSSAGEQDDEGLVMRARSGDRESLESLIRRHQGYVYNIAVRMLYNPQDAEDATQEIFIKALGKLSRFEGRSSFRTWLYRIVVNHVLNMKRGRVEDPALNFHAYSEELDKIPDLEFTDNNDTGPEASLLATETMLSCSLGMLLCLNRKQRLIFILGAVFDISDGIAAELLQVTRENFRQRLTRARRDLRNFMSNRCGLLDPTNPCHCINKTKGFIQAGHVDPNNLLFVREHIGDVRAAVPRTQEVLETLDAKIAAIYHGQPFYRPPELVGLLDALFDEGVV